MNENAIFKISYGLYYLGSEHQGEKNVCVVNTVSQVTQEPLRVSVTILKTSKTHDLINNSKKFSVGIMGIHANMKYIENFGTKSGHNEEKFEGFAYREDKLGNPLVEQDCVATLCCKVIKSVDLGTHSLFIADLIDADILSDEPPMTYNDYRAKKAGTSNNNKPSEPEKEIWQCTVCHYIYDGETPFEELPEDYVCPVCKKPKSVFVKI